MKISEALFLRMYRMALQFYPAAFSDRYREQLIDAVRRSHAESKNDLRLAFSLGWDTVMAALREHWRAATPSSPGYSAAFALFVTALAVVLSVSHQQGWRMGADRKPAALVATVQSRLDHGDAPESILAGPREEIATANWLRSTHPFAVVYDASGSPLAGDATYHGSLPQPPHGIFIYLREHGSHKVTWQPAPGVRIALVGKHLPDGRFILAGQSLLRSEDRTSRFDGHLLRVWVGMIAAILVVTVLSRLRRRSLRP